MGIFSATINLRGSISRVSLQLGTSFSYTEAPEILQMLTVVDVLEGSYSLFRYLTALR